MKKNNFFRALWNFLAIWAGVLVSVFLGIELWAMAKTFVANVNMAYEFATNGWVVLVAMVFALLVAVVLGIKQRRSD